MYSPQLPLARARLISPLEIDKFQSEIGGLESSLLQIYHDHHHSTLKLREISGKAKKDAIRNAARVSDLLVDAVNGGVQESFINEKRIELQIRALAATVTKFMKQTDQWLVATHSINSAIKVFNASMLLDDTANFTSEKTAIPNLNSVGGFDVINNIKTASGEQSLQCQCGLMC